MTSPVTPTRSGGVLQLALDAPRRKNALSRAMLASLAGFLQNLDDTVTGVVLCGQGGVFSAGADFSELTGTSADIGYDDEVAVVAEAITGCERPVIAAIEGPCIGAAVDLALACDLRIAGVGSFLQVPAVRLGLLYNPQSIRRMARSYPRDTVRRLLLLAERFDDHAARDAGLVSHVVPAGEATRWATDLLTPITGEQQAAISATKGLLDDIDRAEPDHGQWQLRRQELLDSTSRHDAILRARSRHVPADDAEQGPSGRDG